MKWFVMEEIPRSIPLMLIPPMQGFADLRSFGAPLAIGYALVDSRAGIEKLVFPREAFSKSARAIHEKLLKDPAWGVDLTEKITLYADAFMEGTERLLARVDFSKKTNEDLARIYEELLDLQRRSHASGLVWFTMEVEDQLLTRTLLDRLEASIGKTGSSLRASEAFSILTTPTRDSFAQKEEKSLLLIASRIKDVRLRKLFETEDLTRIDTGFAKMDPALSAALDSHVRTFGWLPYMYEGPAWDRRYFLEVLRGLLSQDVVSLIQTADKRHAETLAQQKALLDQLRLDSDARVLIDVARGLVFTKGYRKDALYRFFWLMEPYLKEVAKRLHLTLSQVRRFMPWEMPIALRQGLADADELNRRFQCYAFYVQGDSQKVISGKPAEEFLKTFDLEAPQVHAELSELSGECACPGFAKGIVKHVDGPQNMGKMNPRDILVAHATNPDIVPAMKLASAIVTDMGGITCHAAIVSRELKIPCVIGTKVATSALKDGDLVEVDATHGIVRIIK